MLPRLFYKLRLISKEICGILIKSNMIERIKT